MAFNKIIAHNMHAVPVLKQKYAILVWTIQEFRNIDIKIRKILSVTENFHITVSTFQDQKETGIWKEYKLLTDVEYFSWTTIWREIKTEISYCRVCVNTKRMKMWEWQVNCAGKWYNHKSKWPAKIGGTKVFKIKE